MLKALKQLYKETPCKVVSSWKIPKSHTAFGINGAAWYNPYIIYMDKKLPQYQQVWILSHEIGHIIHKINKCGCTKRVANSKEGYKQRQREYHALRYEIEWLINNKQFRALKHGLSVWKKTPGKIHSAAYKRFSKTKYGKKIIRDFLCGQQKLT